jgi:HK97 family phage portal protein
MSLQDAQFIEHHNFSVEQVARIFNIPAKMLATGSGGGNTAGAATVSPDIGYFATMTLGPWLTRFDAALNSDVSIFPDDSGLFAEHKADALLRPDTRERYEAYRAARQGGWITPNELRRWENLPPIEGGDEIQLTPVGGAPNPGNEDEPDPAPSNDNDDTEEETE